MFIFDPSNLKNYSLGGSQISTTFSLYIMLGKSSCYLNVQLAGEQLSVTVCWEEVWVIRNFRVPHDVLMEHLSSLRIQQCIPQLFKVDTVNTSTTTSRSHNRSYVTTIESTRSPSGEKGHAKVDTVKLWCQSAISFFSSPTALQWHNFRLKMAWPATYGVICQVLIFII